MTGGGGSYKAGGARVHGVALALAADADGPLVGVLVLGEAGAGKSLLALDAINGCRFARTRLVADDIVQLETNGVRLEAVAPAQLYGLIEVRGLGPTPIKAIRRSPLRFAIDLSATPERVAEPANFKPLPEGPSLPLYPFRVEAPSAAARLIALARSILVDKTGDAGRNKGSLRF